MDSFSQLPAIRREYTIKAWMRLLYFCLGVFFLTFGVFFGPALYRSETRNLPAALPAVMFLGFGVYMLAMVVRSRLVIDGTHIQVQTAFRERSAEIGDIEGFRTVRSRNGSYIWLKLRQGQGSFTIPPIFDTDGDFAAWMRQVPDLDQHDREQILTEIAQQPALGATPEERLNALPTARTWALFLIVVTVAAAAMLLLAPAFFRPLAVAILVLTPFAAAWLLHHAPLLYAFFKQKADPRAEVSFVPLIAAFGLLIHAGGLHFVAIQQLALIAVPLALAYFAAFASAVRIGAVRPGVLIAVAFFACLYSYGLAAVTDALGDSAVAASYRVDVLDKHVSRGRSTSYSLTLAPWGDRQEPARVGVSESTYGVVGIGDQVCIQVHRGNLRVPWYWIAACSQTFPDNVP
jgi:hypothetical protein